jgi:hypothetical protein
LVAIASYNFAFLNILLLLKKVSFFIEILMVSELIGLIELLAN